MKGSPRNNHFVRGKVRRGCELSQKTCLPHNNDGFGKSTSDVDVGFLLAPEKEIKMKCAVLTSIGKLEIIERDVPETGSFGILITVEICGVCRTDRKAFFMGQRDLRMPGVLGHEIIGRVKETGARVLSVKPGDRVQVFPGVVCGECEYCKAGADNLCSELQIIGFHLDGGFSELLYLPGNAGLNIIPENTDAKAAALAEPLACCLNMQKRMNIGEAESVVVFGAGPLGNLSAQLAHALGAKKVIMVEPCESRRKFAEGYSDYQLDFNDRTASHLSDITGGKGAGAVLLCCPGSAPFEMGLFAAAKRAEIGFFSGLTEKSISTAAINLIHYKELTVIGGYGCTQKDNRNALELLTSGRISVKGAPANTISWRELEKNLREPEPTENIFTYFRP